MNEARQYSGGFGEKLLALLQYPLPHRLLSDIVRWATRRRWRWFKNFLIRSISNRFGIDPSEAVESNRFAYPTFNAFFTRALKSDARPIADNGLISPVDGCVSEIGAINQNRIFQAKGHEYTLEALLACDSDRAEVFNEGAFATLYLSPKDYHRVHMPCSGRLIETAHVPGRLFSVAPFTVRQVPGLFARNERLVCFFHGSDFEFAVILVGAMLVSSIGTVWSGDLKRARRGVIREQFTESPVHLHRGEEMGRFNMGSTVIIVFPKQTVNWSPEFAPEQGVLMGQRMGDLITRARANG